MSCPKEFVRQVRTALSHLNNPAYLENHPLAGRLAADAPALTRGNLLRRTLRLSIEALDPGPETPAGAPAARPYQVLRSRYIVGESMQEIAANLNIGWRQAYRELQTAIRALAQVLWDSGVFAGQGAALEALPAPLQRVRAEVDRLARTSRQEVALPDLLATVVEGAQRLAGEHGPRAELAVEARDLRAAVNRVMLRQAILNLLSHAVRAHRGPELPVRLRRSGMQAVIEFSYSPRDAAQENARPDQPLAVAAQLLDGLGADWRREETAGGEVRVVVRIPLAQERLLLVVDDNEGLIALLQRYLEGEPYRVLGTTSAHEALRMLEELRPDILVLDVMMPQRDGWEVLEMLRRAEGDRHTQVLVCSVINDPVLAAAYGADGFLLKPVDRLGLLQALERLGCAAT